MAGCSGQPAEPPTRHAKKGHVATEILRSVVAEDVDKKHTAGHDWYLHNQPEGLGG
jgi:hypothetical protein